MSLYITSTPIGNLEDVSFRGVRILNEVDFILCEDTRVTKKLLNRYDIKTPTISYHKYSNLNKTKKITELLKAGKQLALVSDAGTPLISDPGQLLIRAVRKDIPNIKIITIPGPSALISAISLSGFPADEFIFLGFLPHKKGREKKFLEIQTSKKTIIFYESPHRLIKTLNKLCDILSSTRKVAVFGELTKIHEKSFIGNPNDILKTLSNNTKLQKGEFTIVVEGT